MLNKRTRESGRIPPEGPDSPPNEATNPRNKPEADFASSALFMDKASLGDIDITGLPPLRDPGFANDDLRLTSFRPSRYIWGGEQRRGVLMHIDDASSIDDHINKAVNQDFLLARSIPLPDEVNESLSFIANTKPSHLRTFWNHQLKRVAHWVDLTNGIQRIWDCSTSPSIRSATGKLKSVAISALLDNFDLGGSAWMSQFTFGFPLVGDLSQEGVYPRDPSLAPAPPLDGIWTSSKQRFLTRSRASGFLNAETLWNEAMDQVKKGWLAEPLPISPDGTVATYDRGPINIAFRFGVDQADKLRACDDLKHNEVNLYCTVWTPIKLPTWDHIAQMCLDIRHTRKPWEFFKSDHEAAYKQLPLRPEHARLAFVALRDPITSRWMAFPPKALLFGATSAVLHYNCFSRLLAVLTNRIFGIPLIGYFDDFGALVPANVGRLALRTFEQFCNSLGITLKKTKTDRGKRIIFLGLQGDFPSPGNKMLLSIDLPTVKATTWCNTILSILSRGVISHDELESLIGRLSFTQTSVFGRIGRGMLAPLYAKLRSVPYHAALSDKESMTLSWWTAALPNMEPRVATPKTDRTDRIVYTDAAGKSRIIAAVILDPANFKRTKYLRSITHVRTGLRWTRTFADTSYIYGLEMLAILATLMERGDDLRNQSVTFYIDNNNALLAILKNSAKPIAIQAMTGLIWHRIQELNITPWFERVPSKRNIADLPTRHVKIKYKSLKREKFRQTIALHQTIETAIARILKGLPVEPPSTRKKKMFFLTKGATVPAQPK